jgi:hypothetical protein
MMATLAALLHRIRDGLLVAAVAVERGDDDAAVDALEVTLADARSTLEELKAS